jgi:pilus assembly protein CpaE
MTEDFEFDIVVIEPDTKLRTRLVSQLGDGTVAGVFADTAELSEFLSSGRLAVAVFGSGLANLAGLADIERVTRTHPEVAAVLIVDELSTNLLQQALRAGVRDVVPGPTEPQQLLESIIRVSETLSHVHGRVTLPNADDPQHGQVITVASMKGGSGKSTVAVNLAVSLARRSSRPVALVDADLQFGDAAVLLKLTPQHTMVDAVSALGRLDDTFIHGLLSRHDPSGLLILPAPIEPAFAEQIAPDDVVRIVGRLREICEYVVVDTPAVLNELVVSLIEHADRAVVVSGTDLPNIKNIKLGLQTLRMLSVDPAKLLLVMNGAGGKSRLDVSEVERTLQMKAACLLPHDVTVPQSINKGVPVVLDAPRSGPARAIEQLADRITGVEATPTYQARKGVRVARASA